MDPFYRHTMELVESIEHSLAKHRMLPCLTLLFVGIDVVATIECEPGEGTRADFVRWVDQYMLKNGRLQCSATDLYGARCGILHSFMADSDLSRRGKARKLLYAWGDANPNDLATASKILGRTDYVGVHVRESVDTFRNGVADYMADVISDPVRHPKLLRGVGRWFVDMSPKTLSDFLEFSRGDNKAPARKGGSDSIVTGPVPTPPAERDPD